MTKLDHLRKQPSPPTELALLAAEQLLNAEVEAAAEETGGVCLQWRDRHMNVLLDVSINAGGMIQVLVENDDDD